MLLSIEEWFGDQKKPKQTRHPPQPFNMNNQRITGHLVSKLVFPHYIELGFVLLHWRHICELSILGSI